LHSSQLNIVKRKEKENKKILKKKYIFLVLLFLSFVAIFHFSSATAFAQTQSTVSNSFDKTTAATAGSAIGGAIAAPFLLAINAVMYAIFMFFGIILIAAGILFDWAINPNNFSQVMNMTSIYNSWMIVRDFLNLFFIFVLLFSAFCTVFGISKYHIIKSKILLMVVIMALLVNFSFPIARFIIDIGNIMMYFIINKTFPGLTNNSGISSQMVTFSGFAWNLLPSAGIWDTLTIGLTVKLVAANVCLFMLSLTILVIAALLLIRILILAILVIFSPIAFTGEILPNFASFSSKWWSMLFKQTFFGPVMAFMLYLSLTMMQELQKKKLYPVVPTSGNYSDLITGVLEMVIPLAIMWLGIIASQQMGAYGAKEVLKYARKAMNWASMAPLKYTGVSGGTKQAFDYYKKKGAPGFLGKIPGLRGSEKTEDAASRWASRFTGGKAGATKEGLERKKLSEKVGEFEKLDLSEADALNKLTRGDSVEKKAAALYLSKKSKLDTSAKFNDAMRALDGNKELQDRLKIQSKKDNNIHHVIEFEATAAGGGKPIDVAIKDNLGKMGPDDIAKQEGLHKLVNDPTKPGYYQHFLDLKNGSSQEKARLKRVIMKLSGNSIAQWSAASSTKPLADKII
jgi:hypothetical protein